MIEQINVPGLLGQPAQPQTGHTTIEAWNGNVVMHVPHPSEHIVWSPVGAISDGAKLMLAAAEADKAMAQLAIDVAMTIVDGIYQLRGDLKPAAPAIKHEMIERHRKILTNRISTVLNSLREKKTINNHRLAKELVTIMLKEVFS